MRQNNEIADGTVTQSRLHAPTPARGDCIPESGLTWECQVRRGRQLSCVAAIWGRPIPSSLIPRAGVGRQWDQPRSRTTADPLISSAAAITQTRDMQPSGRDLCVHSSLYTYFEWFQIGKPITLLVGTFRIHQIRALLFSMHLGMCKYVG